MTKLQIMLKIADFRREYEHYEMEYFICKYHAKRLPKWVLEELLRHCDFKHRIVMLNDCVYSYIIDSYAKDFCYFVKEEKAFLFENSQWHVNVPGVGWEVAHD